MKVAKCPLRGDDQLLAQVLILMKSLRSQAILLILGVIRPVDVTGSAGERSPGAPFCASLTDRGLRLAVLAAVLPDPGESQGTENGNARNGSPGRCRFGESIVQILLFASIILCTLGSCGAGLWMYAPRQIVFPARRT
jgi:hypothetical protein